MAEKTEYQEELEWIRKSKPYLRFDIGDVVYLNSDLERKNPMTIIGLLDITFPEDYSVAWMPANGEELQKDILPDVILTGKNEPE